MPNQFGTYNESEFNTSGAKSSGGVTGSVRVQLNTDQSNYQLKPSIRDNSLGRYVKASGTDRENFGEVIAACMGRAVLGERIPEVSLVQGEGKHTQIASKYLTGNTVETLDDYIKRTHYNSNKLPTKHAKFVTGAANAAAGEVSLDDGKLTSEFKKDLAECIAVSMLAGDHDVNPGNMIVTTNNGVAHVSRIDFGHAFHDLINAPELFGGKVGNTNNSALDFLNREKVAGAKLGGDPSKLWRDYPGLIPSPELAAALIEIGKQASENLVKGTMAAKIQFMELLTAKQASGDHDEVKHIMNSLAAIHNNIRGTKPAIALDYNAPDKFLNAVFSDLAAFSKSNANDMVKAGDIMQLQLKIDKYIQNQTTESKQPLLLELKLQSHYDHLAQKLGGTSGQIEWVKTDANTQAFQGNLAQYIAHRSQVLLSQRAPSPELLEFANTLQSEIDKTPKPFRAMKHGESIAILDEIRTMQRTGSTDPEKISKIETKIQAHYQKTNGKGALTNALSKMHDSTLATPTASPTASPTPTSTARSPTSSNAVNDFINIENSSQASSRSNSFIQRVTSSDSPPVSPSSSPSRSPRNG